MGSIATLPPPALAQEQATCLAEERENPFVCEKKKKDEPNLLLFKGVFVKAPLFFLFFFNIGIIIRVMFEAKFIACSP